MNRISFSGTLISNPETRYVGPRPSVWLEMESYQRRGRKIVPIYVKVVVPEEFVPYRSGDRIWVKGFLRVRRIRDVERETLFDDSINAYYKTTGRHPTVHGGLMSQVDWQKVVDEQFLKEGPPDDVGRGGRSVYMLRNNNEWLEVYRVRRRDAYDIIAEQHAAFALSTPDENNKVQLQGVLKGRPKLDYVPPNISRIRLKLDVEAEKPLSHAKDEFTLLYWGPGAESLYDELRRGDELFALGSLNAMSVETEEWIHNDNNKWFKIPIHRTFYEIEVKQLKRP